MKCRMILSQFLCTSFVASLTISEDVGPSHASHLLVANNSVLLPTVTVDPIELQNFLWNKKHIQWINDRLSIMSTPQVLAWMDATLPHWAVFTSLGPSGIVQLHHLHQIGILQRVPVVMIDTLHLFDETYELVPKVEKFFNITIKRAYPKAGRKSIKTLLEFNATFGQNLWETDPDKYGEVTKVDPTAAMLKKLKVIAWFTGRRKDQGGDRANLEILEDVDGRAKVNSLAHWSQQDVWDYIKLHRLPYNPLHDEGYMSVGDKMTTVKTPEGGSERDGRWAGSNKTECGMHSVKMRSEDSVQKLSAAEWEAFATPRAEALGMKTIKTTEKFKEVVLNTEKNLLCEFYSPYCPHCKAFEHRFNAAITAIKAEYPDDIEVLRIDVMKMKFEEIPAVYTITSTPTLMYITPDTIDKPAKYSGVQRATPFLNWVWNVSHFDPAAPLPPV